MDFAKEGDEEKMIANMIRVEKGDPKNKRLLKYLADNKHVKKDMMRWESIFARDKMTSELEEGLLYIFSDKEHNVSFTEEGQSIVKSSVGELFDIADINEEYIKIEQDESLSPLAKEEKKKKVGVEFEDKTQKIHNLTQLLKAYTVF
jgi:preprotein translocase subunit SecA